MAVKRNENGRKANGQFAEGNSGGGRKKMDPALKAAFVELSEEAKDVLAECMRDEGAKWRDRLAAAGVILDRAYGRVPQATEDTDNERLDAFLRIFAGREQQ